MSWRNPWVDLPGLLLILAAAAACSDGGPEVPGPPYLAIVTRVDLPPGVEPDSFYAYHVRDYAGTAGVDTVVTAAPRDTIILSVPPARYVVTIGNVPPHCAIRQGAEQEVLIPEGTNTAIIRYSITCLPLIALQVSTEGVNPDNEYIYRVIGLETDIVGAVGPNETIYLDNLHSGEYRVELADVKAECTIISLGGRLQRASVSDTVSGLVYFRVACSDPAARPAILSLSALGGFEGVAALARVTDPDRDLELYAADLTDCAGRSVLPNGGVERRNLFFTRLRLEDPGEVMLVLNAPGLSDAVLAASCLWFRMGDQNGNSTEVAEIPVRSGSGANAPVAIRLNGFFSGGLQNFFVDLQADDPDGDFVGTFARLRLRDGVLGPPDGQPDYASYNTIGYRGTDLPVVPIGPGNVIVNYFDILAIEIYLYDAAGHITRAVDDRL
jgi:hypothetical protein